MAITHGLKVLRAVIMGAPASGKGTVSNRIVKQFNFLHFACGDILRQHQVEETALGITAAQYIQSGQLVPDQVVTNCVMETLNNCPTLNEQSWLLDGYPRTMKQAADLEVSQRIDVVLNLVVPHNVIIDRIKGRWIHLKSGRVYNTGFNSPRIPFIDDVTGEPLVQREDDKPETMMRRLQVYTEYTKPLVKLYQQKGILHTFEGNTTDEIWPNIKDFLDEQLSASAQIKC